MPCAEYHTHLELYKIRQEGNFGECSCRQAIPSSIRNLWQTQLLRSWVESYFGLLVLSQFWSRHFFNSSLEIHTECRSKPWHESGSLHLNYFTVWAQALPFSLLLSVPLTQLDLLPQMRLLGEAYPRVMLVWWLQWLTCSLFSASALCFKAWIIYVLFCHPMHIYWFRSCN